MSIPVKINNVQVLSFDITTDDISITGLGNVSSDTPQQNVSSLCIESDCYKCNETQCTSVQCTETKCTETKCTQVKCNQVRCNQVKCTGYDSHCDCWQSTDN